jgi:hypothetical protein
MQAIDGFQHQYDSLGKKPAVRFIQGKEVLKALQREVLHSTFDCLYELTNLDLSYKVAPRKKGDHRSQFRKLKRKSKSIYSCRKGPILPYRERGITSYYIPSYKFDFEADIVVYGDKVSLADISSEDYLGVLITNKKIAHAMKQLFELAAVGAKKYHRRRRKETHQKAVNLHNHYSDGTSPSVSSQNPPEQSTFLKLYHERQSQKQKRIEELRKRDGEENKNGENPENLKNNENQNNQDSPGSKVSQ